jgi:hypothetical protein
MQAAHCALVVALKYLPDDPNLAIARSHLEAAIALSDQYHKAKYSIFWLTAKTSVKRRVKQQLNELAFDTYSHMIDLVNEVNQYAANKTNESIPQPRRWQELIINLHCAFNWIEEEHPNEIKLKQLALPL